MVKENFLFFILRWYYIFSELIIVKYVLSTNNKLITYECKIHHV